MQNACHCERPPAPNRRKGWQEAWQSKMVGCHQGYDLRMVEGNNIQKKRDCRTFSLLRQAQDDEKVRNDRINSLKDQITNFMKSFPLLSYQMSYSFD